MNNSITLGPVGIPGIPDKRWIRMIKIRKLLELWK